MNKVWMMMIATIFLLVLFSTSMAVTYDAVIYQAQQRLKALGYDPGAIDGYWGSRTENAVRTFQQDNGLPVSGHLDEATRKKLNLAQVPLGSSPQFPISTILQECADLIQQESFKAAIQKLKEFIAENPQNAEAYYLLIKARSLAFLQIMSKPSSATTVVGGFPSKFCEPVNSYLALAPTGRYRDSMKQLYDIFECNNPLPDEPSDIPERWVDQRRIEIKLKAFAWDTGLRRLSIEDKDALKLFQQGQQAYQQRNYQEALKYYNKSLEIAEQLNNLQGIAANRNNIGLVYHALAQNEEALRSYEEALRIWQELQNLQQVATTLDNMGTANSDLGRYGEAFRSIKEALRIRRELKIPEEIAHSLNSIGTVYKPLGQYDAALRSFEEALRLWRGLQILQEVAITLNNIGMMT